MNIHRFQWNNSNVEHIVRHEVTPEEVEEVFRNRPFFRKARKDRWIAYGSTESGRLLFVVFESVGGTARVVTAREMDLSERRYYRRETGE